MDAFNRVQSKTPISAASSSNGVFKTSEWTEDDQSCFEVYVGILDKKSDTYLEEIADGIPSKTVTQVARRCLSLGGAYDFVDMGNGPTQNHGNPHGQDGSSWTEVEHKSLCIGIAHFGEGNWEDITKYCVKTKTVYQVAQYWRNYCDLMKRPTGIETIQQTTLGIDITPQPAYPDHTEPQRTVGSTFSSEHHFSTGVPLASSASAPRRQSSNTDAQRLSSERHRDGMHSGDTTLSSEQASDHSGSTELPPLMLYVQHTGPNNATLLQPSPMTDSVIMSAWQSNGEEIWCQESSRVQQLYGDNGHDWLNQFDPFVATEGPASMLQPVNQVPELNGGLFINGQSDGMVTYAEDNSGHFLNSENNQLNGLMDGIEELSQTVFYGWAPGSTHPF